MATGLTREAAAAAVGPAADDLFLTSHADFSREVDLDSVDALDLVADEDYESVLLDACRRLHERGAPALRVAVLPGSARSVLAQLDRGGVTITDAEHTDSSVLLTLGVRGDRGSAHDLLVLSAIDAAAAASPPDDSRPTPSSEPASVPGGPSAATRVGRRPTPVLLDELARVRPWVKGPRRRLLALGALGLVFVALLLIGLVPDSPRVLVSVALSLLVVLVLVGTAAGVYTTLLLARQVHVQTERLEKMVVRNREVVHERTSALSRRLQVVEVGQARLPFLEQHLDALAEASAASSTRVRDLLDRLEAEEEPPSAS